MIRVLLSENEPGEADGLVAALGEAREIQVVGLTRDGLETAQTIAHLRPDVALVRAHMAGMDGFRVCRLSALASPETVCVLVVTRPEGQQEALAEAMRSGARGVTHLRTDADHLLRLVGDLHELTPRRDEEEFQLVIDPARMPVTLAVTGAKGGIGKTTIATNLAVALAQRFPQQVVLLDFVGQYGDAKLLLNLRGSGSLVDLADYEELDEGLVRARLLRHESGLTLFAGAEGPETMEATGKVSLPLAGGLLGTLRREFRVIVVDLPALLYPLSQYFFMRSNYVVVVTTLSDLATIRNTAQLLDSLVSGGVPEDRLKLVVNRFDPGEPFGLADLAQVTRLPVAAQIPRAAEVVVALNQGVPFVTAKPNAPVSRAVERLAQQLVGQMAAPGATTAAG